MRILSRSRCAGTRRSVGIALTAVLILTVGIHTDPVEAQDGAFLSGTVVDELTLAPVAGAVVEVLGRSIAVSTDDFGQFSAQGLPAEPASIKISAPGYVSVVELIDAASTDFIQVRLRPMAVALDELLVRTSGRTGAAERILVPGDEATRSALDLLDDEVPGVQVNRAAGLGGGASIAIRGAGSFRDNAPDVFVDGVRVDDPSDPSRALHVLDLIPGDMVARIRVLRGPAAAAAYSFGANGVVLVETHRGGGRM